MYPVSNDYKTAIAARTVTSKWYGSIVTTAGDTITFNEENLDQNKSHWVSEYTTGDTLSIGTAYSSQVTIALRGEYDRYQFYNGEITLYFRLYLTANTYEDVPCGTFTITDAKFTYHTVTLTAYDNMQKFNKALTETISNMAAYSAISIACTTCGVTLGSTQADIESLTNGTHTFHTSVMTTENTYRDMIGYLCAGLACNAIIGRDGKLYLKGYSTTSVRTLGASNRYDSSYIDYLGRYTRIALTNKDGTEEVYAATGTYDGQALTMSIGSNPILNDEEVADRATLAAAVINALAVVKYAPCSITMPSDASLDIGDSITVSGGNIETPVMAILTKIDVTLFSKTIITSAGGNYELAEKRAATQIEKAVQNTSVQTAQLQNQVAVIASEVAQISGSVMANYILPFGIRLDEITDIDAGGALVNVLQFHFESDSEGNTATFYSKMLFNVHTNIKNNNYQDAVVTIKYLYDNTVIQTFVEYYRDGWHAIELNAIIGDIELGMHNFWVQMQVQGGTLY